MDDNKVGVLLEDLRAQFRTFGEGLQLLNEKVDREFSEIKSNISGLKNEVTNLKHEVINIKHEVSSIKTENHQEHQQLMQMVKELDLEVQVELKRVK
jgi:peptidoglycan hydrolase CwlO-like protein